MPGERGPTVDNSRLLDYGAATSSHPKNNRGGRPHLRPPPLGMTDIASLTKTFLKACRKTIAITGTTTLYSRSRSYNSFYVTELLQRWILPVEKRISSRSSPRGGRLASVFGTMPRLTHGRQRRRPSIDRRLRAACPVTPVFPPKPRDQPIAGLYGPVVTRRAGRELFLGRGGEYLDGWIRTCLARAGGCDLIFVRGIR